MTDYFYILQPLSDSIRLRYLVAIIAPILIYNILLKVLWNKMPIDRGREYAVEGSFSKGKPTGTGIILAFSFVLSFLLVAQIQIKWLVFLSILVFEMFTGFFDDKAKVPWNEAVKAGLDFAACISLAIAFNHFTNVEIDLLLFTVNPSSILGYLIIVLFLWLCINSFNCSDGIDGLSGSLAINSLLFIGIFSLTTSQPQNQMISIAILGIIILVYLWYNSEQSSVLMGDAGSRFIGLFLGLLILETGQMWIAIPFAFSIILDGFPGLVKILLIKLFKRNIIKVRLPLHDYLRKDLMWSNSKIVVRLNIIQIVVSVIAIMIFGIV